MKSNEQAYIAPEVNPHGSIEKLTRSHKKNKVGFSDDQFSPGTPLVGSLVDAGTK